MNNIVKIIMLSFLAGILFSGCESSPEKNSDASTPTETYKYDVTDEAIIDASPDVVYRALVDECSGKTNWWQPRLSAKLRQGTSSDEIGAVTDITIGKIKLVAKTVEVKKNELVRINYFEGPFRGEDLWKLENVDGKSKISFRWQANPSGILIRFFDLFLDIEKSYSEMMKIGFDNLNKFLKEQSPN